ncbi:hypothetical protein Tco_0161742 [Tanacetum coccineum]
MIRRVDDFVKSEKAYMSTKLLKGEQPKKGPRAPFRGGRLPRPNQGNRHQRTDNYGRKDHYQPYALSWAPDRRTILLSILKKGNWKPGSALESASKLSTLGFKSRHNQTEEWMNVPVIFPPILEGDVSDDPLIIEANVEGSLNPNPDGTSWFHRQTADPSRKSGVRGSQVRENPEIREHEEPEDSGEEMVLINLAYLEQKVKIDVFAWQPSVMVGVLRRIIKHNLKVNMPVTLVAQKRRVLGTKKDRAVIKEVEE